MERLAEHQAARALADGGEPIPICTNEERWASEPVFAVMSHGRKSAHRNCGSKEDADAGRRSKEKGEFVQERERTFGRCELKTLPSGRTRSYCDARNNGLCPYYK